MRILVSACLLGVMCRYDGMGRQVESVTALLREHELVPVCPEQLGGLPTPRPPCEIVGGKVLTGDGLDQTLAYRRGAREAHRLYKLYGCRTAILKARSPSCGKGAVYDGSFSGKTVPGNGVFAQRLLDDGVMVLTEEELQGAGL